MADAPDTQSPEAAPPKPGEIRIDLQKLSGSEYDAADALQGLLDDPHEDSPDGADQSAETGQAETPATEETNDGQSELGATPAIEPPASWTADEKKEFAALPLATQQALSRRESERERLLSTQGHKSSEEAQKLTAARTALETERAQATQLLQSVIVHLTPELQRFQNADWAKLAAETPAEWAKQKQAYDDVVQRMSAAHAHINNIAGQQQAETKKRHDEFAANEFQKLITKVPEFADPVKGKALAEGLMKALPEIPQDEWKAIVDHRYLLIARDAMLYRQAVAARAAAQNKRTPAPQSNVRPLRPGAARSGDDTAQQKRVVALHGNLRKTGTTQAAADLLMATGAFDS